MDLLILCSIGLLGYKLFDTNSIENYQSIYHTDNKEKCPQNKNQKQLFNEYNIPDNNVKLDLFTGNIPKIEKNLIRDPNLNKQQFIYKKPNITGEKISGILSDKNKFQGVPVVQPINVGPGINDMSVQAKGGFHPFERTLPKDLSKNNREKPAYVTPGAMIISKLNENIPQVYINENKKTTIQEPILIGKSSIMKHKMTQQTFNPVINNRGKCDINKVNISGFKAIKQISDSTRFINNRNISNCNQNIIGPSFENGLKNHNGYYVVETERGKDCNPILGANLENMGKTVSVLDNLNTTNRETLSDKCYDGNAVSNVNAPIAPTKYDIYDVKNHTCYTPGAGSKHFITSEQIGLVDQKNDEGCESFGIIKGTQAFELRPEEIKTSIKNNCHNNLMLDLAQKQLQSNCYALNIN